MEQLVLKRLNKNLKSGGGIVDEGKGYFSLVGVFMGNVGYIAIPFDHPDCRRDMHDEVFWALDVNGGITFKEDNVFGWDYAHAHNWGTPEEHVKNAFRFFRIRELDHKITIETDISKIKKMKEELLAIIL